MMNRTPISRMVYHSKNHFLFDVENYVELNSGYFKISQVLLNYIH